MLPGLLLALIVAQPQPYRILFIGNSLTAALVIYAELFGEPAPAVPVPPAAQSSAAVLQSVARNMVLRHQRR